MKLHVLFESATGYAIFSIEEAESVDLVKNNSAKYSSFSSNVRLVGFTPFTSAEEALSNINAVTEDIVTDFLADFLVQTLPSPKKNKDMVLGVSETKLGGAITKATRIKCTTSDIIIEILRGIRQFFERYIKEMQTGDIERAQLGLGHSYSRAKVKFNINRVDNMIIHAISLLDQLDKDCNMYCMRAREWYGYCFPELTKLVTDNYDFVRIARILGDRTQLEMGKDYLPEMENILKDSGLCKTILSAARYSMGMDVSTIDYSHMSHFLERTESLCAYRNSVQQYLTDKMKIIAPNLSTLVGDVIAARLICKAGSLVNLAKCPASTVQILGAEKALFRALKTRGKTPKYGLLYHSTFIGKAEGKNKGRISRYLANKCSSASRIDCFSENPTWLYGAAFKKQVEERMAFFTEGKIPERNNDVMNSVSKQLSL